MIHSIALIFLAHVYRVVSFRSPSFAVSVRPFFVRSRPSSFQRTWLITRLLFISPAAAVLIWKGGQQSKKVKEVEDKLRGALGIVEEGDEEDEAVRAGDVVEEKRIGPAPIGHHVQEAGSDSVAGRSSQEKSEARLSGEDNGTDAKGVALGRVV